jgi:O-antigen ligase
LAILRYRRLWLGLLPAALLLALTPVGRALYGRVLSGFAGQDKAAAMRVDEYRNALEIIQQHPLIGIGFGSPPAIDLAPGVSSQYLTIGEALGLPALVLYLGLLAYLLVRAARALLFERPPAAQQSALGALLAALVAALVAGLFDHYWSSPVFPHMVALFWLLAALLYRAATPTANATESDQGVRHAPGLANS